MEIRLGRLQGVDVLRGVAALAVLLTHSAQVADAPGTGPFLGVRSVFERGALGVPLFFVISGFCIHLPWTRGRLLDPSYRINLRSFWKRRLFRLYPPYFLALCLTMTMVWVAYRLGIDAPLIQNYPEPRPQWMLADFLAHVTMLHGLHPVFDTGGGNPVYWTLAREEYFYALYLPLLFCRTRAGLWKTVAAIGVLSLAFPILMNGILSDPSSPWVGTINSSAFALWIQWVLGAVAAEAYMGMVRLPSWCSKGWLVPFWMGVGLVVERLFVPAAPLFWGLAFFTLLNSVVKREAAEGKSSHVAMRWLAGVGLFSYSLYLVHNPVRIVLRQVLLRVTEVDSWGFYWAAVFVTAAAGYAAGWIYFRLVESRFLLRGKSTSGEVAPLNDPQAAVSLKLTG